MGKQLNQGYYVSTAERVVIAWVGYSEPLAAIVAALMQEYPRVYVDAPNFITNGRPATWLVSADTDLGVPVWRRLDQDDADRRAVLLQAVAEVSASIVDAVGSGVVTKQVG